MNERERLADLIRTTPKLNFPSGSRAQGKTYQTALNMADHLLANGVILPPCKLGDRVWFIQSRGKIAETNVEKIVLKGKGIYIKLACNAMYETSCNSIGKTVFFTQEEAEKALAERGKE
jgi:hypothetical protein